MKNVRGYSQEIEPCCPMVNYIHWWKLMEIVHNVVKNTHVTVSIG